MQTFRASSWGARSSSPSPFTPFHIRGNIKTNIFFSRTVFNWAPEQITFCFGAFFIGVKNKHKQNTEGGIMRLDWGLLIPVGFVILLWLGIVLIVTRSAKVQVPKEGTYGRPDAMQKYSSRKKSPRRREWEERKEKEGNSGG